MSWDYVFRIIHIENICGILYNFTGVLDVWLLIYKSIRIYINILTCRVNTHTHTHTHIYIYIYIHLFYVHTHTHTHTHTLYIYIYMNIVIHGETVSLYLNSSMRLDTWWDASSCDGNLADFTPLRYFAVQPSNIISSHKIPWKIKQTVRSGN